MTSSPSEPERLDVRQRGDAREQVALSAGARPIPATLGDPAARCSPRPTSPRSAGPSSSTTRSSARGPCGGPEAADAAVLDAPRGGPGDRGRDRRQRPPGRLRPLRAGRSRRCSSAPQNLACVGAEPLGLTNCLNFGNPEKPRRRLAARPRGRRARRRLRGARRPGRRRQRLALQRDRARADLPDAGGRHGRRAARPRRRAAASAPREGDAIALVGPFAPSLAGSELAKLRGELGRGLPAADVERGRRRRCRCPRGGRAAARSPPPTTSATAGSPARSPRWRSPAGSAPRSTSTRWSSCAAAPARRALFGEGPGGVRGRGERSALGGARRGDGVDVLRASARPAATALEIDGRRAHALGPARRRRARLALARERLLAGSRHFPP